MLIDAESTVGKAFAVASLEPDYQKEINDINQKLIVSKRDMTVLKWGVGLIITFEVLPNLKNLGYIGFSI